MRKAFTLFILLGCLTIASACAEYSKDGRWRYELDEDGCVCLVCYYAPSDPDLRSNILRVPDTVDGHTVTKLDYNALDNYYDEDTTVIVFPATLLDVTGAKDPGTTAMINGVRIPDFLVPKQVERFEVEEGNPVFFVQEGVLYKENVLFSVPPALSMQEINVPEGVTAIFERALSEVQGLERLCFPSTLVTVSTPGVADKYLALPKTVREITVAESNPVFHVYKNALYEGNTLLMVPPALECDTLEVEAGTTGIFERAFCRCKGIRAVHLPQGLETISSDAFYNCRNMEEINIPAQTRYIGPGAFSYCWEMKTCLLDEDNPVYSLENGALIERESQTLIAWFADKETENLSIRVPEGIKVIGPCAFTTGANCMKQLELPDSVTDIGPFAFYCSDLIELTLPPMLHEVSDCLCGSSKYLVSVRLPEHLAEVRSSAFQDCVSLRFIELPDSVNSISDYAFKGCEHLEAVILPKDLQEISSNMFQKCVSLRYIATSETRNMLPDWEDAQADGIAILPLNLQRIGYQAMMDCASLTQVVFPPCLQELYYSALSNCTGLTSATIPSGHLCFDSFSGCANLRWVVLGKGVSEVDTPFDGCSSLEWIRIENNDFEMDYYFSPCKGYSGKVLVPRTDMIPGSENHEMFVLTDYYTLGRGEWTAIFATDEQTARALAAGDQIIWLFDENRSLEPISRSYKKKVLITHALTMRVIAADGSESSAREIVTLSPGAFSLGDTRVEWQWDEEAGELTMLSPDWRIVFVPAEGRNGA